MGIVCRSVAAVAAAAVGTVAPARVHRFRACARLSTSRCACGPCSSRLPLRMRPLLEIDLPLRVRPLLDFDLPLRVRPLLEFDLPLRVRPLLDSTSRCACGP